MKSVASNTVLVPFKIFADMSHPENWNLVCARMIEQFGLGGDRYTTSTNGSGMLFHFKSAEDALVAKLMVGDQ
jgi:hypothetical protein